MLLSTAYFPPIEYFAAIADGMILSKDKAIPSVVYIESQENYCKQTYRNRCVFYADGGPEAINVPIVHDDSRLITDIKVDYKTPWVLRAKRAISSAYESSAYFEYYKDELFAILDSQPEKLFDLNLQIIEFFLKKTGIAADIRLTEKFTMGEETLSLYGEDLRNVIHPKKANTILEDRGLKKPYFQVFASKHGFKYNLSIMDLLFNEGPDSILFLKNL